MSQNTKAITEDYYQYIYLLEVTIMKHKLTV